MFRLVASCWFAELIIIPNSIPNNNLFFIVCSFSGPSFKRIFASFTQSDLSFAIIGHFVIMELYFFIVIFIIHVEYDEVSAVRIRVDTHNASLDEP